LKNKNTTLSEQYQIQYKIIKTEAQSIALTNAWSFAL